MSKNPNTPVPLDQAKNITQQLVTPMLMLTRYEVIPNMETGRMKVNADPADTIECLFHWQGIITAITMRQHSQAVLEYLMKIRSIDMDLINTMQRDIAVADDNISLLEKELLKFGITL